MEPLTKPDFFVVSGDRSTWSVSTTMARHIEACLDARPRPRWITFVDLSGARVRVRARHIDSLTRSTAEQRAVERARLDAEHVGALPADRAERGHDGGGRGEELMAVKPEPVRRGAEDILQPLRRIAVAVSARPS
jgi:hypothetical protein